MRGRQGLVTSATHRLYDCRQTPTAINPDHCSHLRGAIYEGLGGTLRALAWGGAFTCLNLEVVVPVWVAPTDELPKAGSSVGKKEQWAPALVLRDMNSLMNTNDGKLLAGDRENYVTEDDASKWQSTCEPAAVGIALAIRDLERSLRPLGFATASQRERRERQTNDGARRSPQHLCELEPEHACD